MIWPCTICFCQWPWAGLEGHSAI